MSEREKALAAAGKRATENVNAILAGLPPDERFLAARAAVVSSNAIAEILSTGGLLNERIDAISGVVLAIMAASFTEFEKVQESAP